MDEQYDKSPNGNEIRPLLVILARILKFNNCKRSDYYYFDHVPNDNVINMMKLQVLYQITQQLNGLSMEI